MLHYVHQIVTNLVCLLFDAGQMVCSGFLESFSLKVAASCSRKEEKKRVNQNSTVFSVLVDSVTMSWELQIQVTTPFTFSVCLYVCTFSVVEVVDNVFKFG